MGFNPLKTRKEWQQIKKEHGIPDRVIKGGSFGEKMEKQQKKFESLGLRNVTNQNATAALTFVRDTEPLLDDWLSGARKLKATDFKNQQKAIASVQTMKDALGILKQLAEAKLNPIGMSKANWNKFEVLFKDAQKNQTDPAKLHWMYSQGIRNFIGQGFHDAYKLRATLNYPGSLISAIEKYEQVAEKWNDLNNDTSPLEDDRVRTDFWKDMIGLRRLGKQIIEAGT